MNTQSVADYYWRDYTGLVPPDAIPGGEDINGKLTYIGQCFFLKYGVYPGTIYPDKPDMDVPFGGSGTSCQVGVKILCSKNPDNFKWENATSLTMHLTTSGKHVVIGGYLDDKIVNIGRVMYQGELVVGEVHGYNNENAKMYFIHRNKEVVVVRSYQVLLYSIN